MVVAYYITTTGEYNFGIGHNFWKLVRHGGLTVIITFYLFTQRTTCIYNSEQASWKVTKQFWLFLFACFSPLLSLSLPNIFTFSGNFFVGKVLGKAFKILGLDERKGRWVAEQDFRGNCQLNITWFSASFSGRVHTKNCHIFWGLFKDYFWFSRTTYQECNFTNCTQMHIPSPF